MPAYMVLSEKDRTARQWQEGEFVPKKERKSGEGKEGAEMAGEGGEAAGNCRTQHNLSH